MCFSVYEDFQWSGGVHLINYETNSQEIIPSLSVTIFQLWIWAWVQLVMKFLAEVKST